MILQSKGTVYRECNDSPLKSNINVSNIFDFLVREASKKCERYCGDIVYDINNIRTYLDNTNRNEDIVSKTFFIGFRECGTDGNEICIAKFEDPKTYGNSKEIYKSLYAIVFIVDEENFSITCSLYDGFKLRDSFKGMKDCHKRANMVRAMDMIVRSINDESAWMDSWLSSGVADGDITGKGSDEDLEIYYEDDNSFANLMALFLKILKKKNANNLYFDKVLSKESKEEE